MFFDMLSQHHEPYEQDIIPNVLIGEENGLKGYIFSWLFDV